MDFSSDNHDVAATVDIEFSYKRFVLRQLDEIVLLFVEFQGTVLGTQQDGFGIRQFGRCPA